MKSKKIYSGRKNVFREEPEASNFLLKFFCTSGTTFSNKVFFDEFDYTLQYPQFTRTGNHSLSPRFSPMALIVKMSNYPVSKTYETEESLK